MSLLQQTVAALSAGLARREFSAAEVTDAYLAEIDRAEPAVGAFVTVTADRARQQAAAVDARRAAGETLSPLAGVPAALKDNLCTRGVRTTCASRMLENFVPPYDATAVEKLAQAGTVTLGKVNMDEFAMGSSTETSYFHPTRNPRDLTRVPGGSSGGSAACVAAGEAPFALGSDTGGSIRQPAAFCGVVGMKPTYGAVSRYGLVAFASSLDQIGPLTRTVEDNALVLNVIAGHDRRDATSVDREHGNFTAALHDGVRGLTIGLPRECFGEGLDPAVKDAVLAAAAVYEKLGARIAWVSLPALANALPAYYVISSAEASSNLARFDGVRYGFRPDNLGDGTMDDLYRRSRSEGFGAEVKRRILLGTFALSAGYYDAYYKKALQVRTLIRQDMDAVLGQVDVLLSPVAPTTAYRLGEKRTDPLAMYLGDVYTVPVNIAGVPALSLPCGRDGDGLPVGMQLIGRAFDEATLYRFGQAYESETGALAPARQEVCAR